ncbi:serine/threonine-protein kinase [Nonomuraea cavernae]|uniref:non-specific serine/threonine protein kinase n=1 Tax=Nonomuraea cavernae TaxID=2045107 RepID=A0A917Z999_9ACTN|nr:serine/threonine-protein kinase [Nonomuraea cavernae]MCA2190189.1 protein kinase [Nonomuraea cavernae]GGO78703.1 putative serine/threonine-protein kinase PknA [Nonomuraea cavernae]
MFGPGTTLNDRYVLTDRLGGGGMGEVWRADDSVLGRTVAIKVMMPALAENPAFARRFQNEARAMATLRHPGVVDVYDYGACEVDQRRFSFLVMELVHGESLDHVLRRGPLGPDATMRLVAEVADALAAAHAQGIVHRDVKPANLMIRSDGRAALTDFGIAHSVSAGQLTATGTMLGSAAYCAPEMAMAGDVTPAVDLYSLGVVAYECLTGRLPFQGDTPVQIIYKHLHAPVPELPADVPPGPRRLVERALEKTPERRWASANEVALAARQAMGTAASSAPSASHAFAPAAASAGASATASGVADGTEHSTLPGAEHHAPHVVPEARSGTRRRVLTAGLAILTAIVATVAVAGSVWIRSDSAAEPVTVPPAVSTSQAPSPGVTPSSRQPVRQQQQAPPTKDSSAPVVTATTSPSATPSATPTGEPEPTGKPTTSPPEPEPTEEPPSPGPQEPEPTAEEPKPTGDIQCIREPCP